jgi:hypothetical protein
MVEMQGELEDKESVDAKEEQIIGKLTLSKTVGLP